MVPAWFSPLPVAIPLLTAALLSAVGELISRRARDLIALAAAAAVTVVCARLAIGTLDAPIVYWFGGWTPRAGAALGISFVIDPVGAGTATVAALLVTMSMLFSWHYFKAIKALYHALMLAFLAAMCGFCLTGDLFNLFVWFELMSAAGIALCGYKSEELGPLQGATNFAVTNTVGAFLSLTGIALAYGRTGALNMAQIGDSLHSPDALVIAAFAFFALGMLVKAAIVPFHFWLADAHAVAPTPVCVLFSGIMVELGLYAVARVYWSSFRGALGGLGGVSELFLFLGSLTAIVGAIMCFMQRHIKRLLAFSTISHMGLMLSGFALLDPGALGGVLLYVAGHAAVKGSLFIVAGVLLHRFQSVDEYELRGRGRHMPKFAILAVLAALGLAALPLFPTFAGEDQILEAGRRLGYPWMEWVFTFAGAVTAASVLRVWGRVFAGWGEKSPTGPGKAKRIPEGRETRPEVKHEIPFVMTAPVAVLLALGAAAELWQPFRVAALAQAARFCDQARLIGLVLPARAAHSAVLPALAPKLASPSYGHAALTLAIAIALSALALFPRTLPRMLRPAIDGFVRLFLVPLRDAHSGRVGDYVAWFALGAAGCAVFLVSSAG